MNDPIGDLLVRMKNASKAKHRYFDIPWSGIKQDIVEIFKRNGLVAHFLVRDEKGKKSMRVFLKYGSNREAVLTEARRVSKPSLRRYITSKKIPKVLGGMGIAVVSTSEGVLEGKVAKEKNLGGELLCLAW